MTIIKTIVLTTSVFAVASFCCWVLDELRCQFAEDNDRMRAALAALQRHRTSVAKLMENENIDPLLRRFVIDLAEIVTEQTAARQLIEWMESRPARDDLSEEHERFDAAMRDLEVTDRRAWEDLSTAVKSGCFAMIAQWPHLSMRFRALGELNEKDSRQAIATAASYKKAAAGRGSRNDHAYA